MSSQRGPTFRPRGKHRSGGFSPRGEWLGAAPSASSCWFQIQLPGLRLISCPGPGPSLPGSSASWPVSLPGAVALRGTQPRPQCGAVVLMPSPLSACTRLCDRQKEGEREGKATVGGSPKWPPSCWDYSSGNLRARMRLCPWRGGWDGNAFSFWSRCL